MFVHEGRMSIEWKAGARQATAEDGVSGDVVTFDVATDKVVPSQLDFTNAAERWMKCEDE